MASEMRGFVFSVVFILIFATLISSLPAGLQGPDEDPDPIIPVDPSLLSGFDATVNWTPAVYTGGPPVYVYEYDLGDYTFRTYTDDDTTLSIGAKVFWFFFWFGAMDMCKFKSPSGADRGTQLAFDEIDDDAEDGVVSYSMTFTDSGESAGSLIVYWNNTAYPSVNDAWDNDAVDLLHGVGLSSNGSLNAAELILGLLFFQLPDVPFLINVFIAGPIWACVVYILWYILKEMTPFL